MFFEFNLYSSLLLIGFLQGLVFAALAFGRWRREGRRSDFFLAAILLVSIMYIAQYMLGFAGWYDSHDWRSTFMFYFPFHVLVFLGPLLWFYFRSLTNGEFKLKRSHWLHFLPGALVLGIYLVCFLRDVVIVYWLGGHPFPQHFGTKGLWADYRQLYVWAVQVGVILSVVYISMILREYRAYRKYLNDHFSATENLQFSWFNRLLYVVVAAILINFLLQLTNEFLGFSYKQFWFSHFTIAVMAYLLAILGYTSTSGSLPDLSFQPVAPSLKNIAPESEIEGWKKRIQELMDREALYLEPTITLGQLAQRLNTNTSVLSKAINTGFGQNFNDFINSQRVSAVEQQLAAGANRNFTLMSIALDCGFNSKATFNRAFRKFTGMTPREYLKNKVSNLDLI